jgi:XRE family transcriptional regulator, regulator of sulfur utilization
MITRRDVAVAGLTALAVVAWAQTTEKPVLKSAVFRWESLTAVPTRVGARREVFDERTATMDRLECHVTTLNPGEAPHAGHQHPEEELVFIREGTIESVQNSTTNRVGPGAVIFEASNEYHSLRNVGQTTATYYVVKFFPPGLVKAKAE